MKSVKIREIAEALRCAGFDLSIGSAERVHLTPAQSEMLAELAVRGMITPTEEMIREGVAAAFSEEVIESEAERVWEAMCQEALR